MCQTHEGKDFAVIIAIDMHKHNSEIRILLGYLPDERGVISGRHNQGQESVILIESKADEIDAYHSVSVKRVRTSIRNITLVTFNI